MQIVAVGLNHKTAPVAIRETISFPEAVVRDALKTLSKYKHIKECVILSTCNRVEVYAVVDEPEKGIHSVKTFMAHYNGKKTSDLEDHLYTYHGRDAVNHVFRVVASLDSMIVGEPQIFGQLKDAYNFAFESGTTRSIFNTLFKYASQVGKEVRSETQIGKNAVSISFAAVELAKKIFGDVEGKTVMIVGAGEMGELTARHLVSNGVSHVLVTNRTFSKAEELAEQFHGTPVPFEKMYEKMVEADIVISSTGAKNCVISKAEVAPVLQRRMNRPVFFIDIAVPRDIEAEVNSLDNAYLYDIDDLQMVVAANIKEREKEIPLVEAIIHKHLKAFLGWYSSLDMVPAIISLRRKLDNIRESEIARSSSSLAKLPPELREQVEILTKSIINKILHDPVTELKKQAEHSNGYAYVEALGKLFNLKIDHQEK